MKYRIMFSGCPKGRLNTAVKDYVVKEVEADNFTDAQLKAYETHEHIWHGVGGVRVQLIES